MPQQQVNWNQCLQHAAVSDIGMRRSNNQDSYSVVLASDVEHWYQRGHMFLVADGMGAHAAGELASKLAVDGIPHLYHKHHEVSPPEALQRAIQDTNIEVNRRGQANPDFKDMGTTTSVLVMLPQGALIAHIGDSRIYRLRGEKLRQLTFDHSLVWETKANGKLPDGVDIGQVVPKNVITRSLGPNARVKIDFEGPYPVAVGDTFLLCSDGLTGRVEDEELAAFMAHMPPKEAAAALTDLANARGGPDNITNHHRQGDRSASHHGGRPGRTPGARCGPPRTTRRASGNLGCHGRLHSGRFGHGGDGLRRCRPDSRLLRRRRRHGRYPAEVRLVQTGREERGRPHAGKTAGGAVRTPRPTFPARERWARLLQDGVARTAGTLQKHNQEMDFERVRREAGAAVEAANAGDHAKAMETFSKSIAYMLQQIRQQQKSAASDSNVL